MREIHMSDHRSTQYHRILLVVASIFGLVRAGSAPPYHSYGPPISHPNPHFKGPHILPYPPCPEYGGCRTDHSFVPAPPGETPNCANSGSTFCENIDDYPQHVIQKLLDNAEIDFGTLIKDESRDEFKPKTTTTTTTTTTHRPYVPQSNYGLPYPGHQSPIYSPHLPAGGLNPPHIPIAPPSVPPHTAYHLNFSQLPGYPIRQYTLFHYNPPADDPDFIYSALIRPELVAQQFNQQVNQQATHTPWWKRFTRSKGSTAGDKIRTRRQSNGNGNGTSVTLCPTRSEYVMPKAAMNSKGNWMYVVNLEQDRFTQLVRSTTCISQQCSGLCSLPSGYTSRCEQQYVQKRLVALESGGGRLYTDVFWFPHCCLCQITQTGNTNNG